MNCLTLAHNKWVRCVVIFFLALSNAESTISASDVKYCYGVDYNETIGQQFITCAVRPEVWLIACVSEYQTKLEFAIANQLYETCSQPQCVYYSMELAFRWNETFLCYSEKENTGVEDQCWESEYNDFYTSGDLLSTLATFCFATAAPSLIPTSYPSAYPTQWCDGEEYTETMGTKFVACGIKYSPLDVLKVEACDEDYQDALYFGIANELFDTCALPYCVWANLDYAFRWVEEKQCYTEVYNDTNADCWTGWTSFFYSEGHLEEKLDLICFDTVTPTPMPTETPSLSPTEDPTGSPSNAPTTFPSPTPTSSPTPHPTWTPTMVPSQTPTGTPTMVPSQTPTATPSTTPTYTPALTRTPTYTPAPTRTPKYTPTNTQTNYPTASPSHRPRVYPTTGSPTVHPTENPTSNPTMHPVQKIPLDSSVFVSADVSCITKQQIAGTIAPLGRVVNVTVQKIVIETYSKLSRDVAGLERDGFRIQWLVVLTRKDKTDDLVEMIKAGDITKELTLELETEFNKSNCSMIVENITAWSVMDSSAMTLKNNSLLVALTCGLIIIALCILFAVMCCRRYKSDSDSPTAGGCPYEEHQDTFAGSEKVGKTANTTTQAGGAGAITPKTKKKKSKSVSFTSRAFTKNEAGAVKTNGKKTRGKNGKKGAKTKGTNGQTATVTRGTNGEKEPKIRGVEV